MWVSLLAIILAIILLLPTLAFVVILIVAWRRVSRGLSGINEKVQTGETVIAVLERDGKKEVIR